MYAYQDMEQPYADNIIAIMKAKKEEPIADKVSPPAGMSWHLTAADGWRSGLWAAGSMFKEKCVWVAQEGGEGRRRGCGGGQRMGGRAAAAAAVGAELPGLPWALSIPALCLVPQGSAG